MMQWTRVIHGVNKIDCSCCCLYEVCGLAMQQWAQVESRERALAGLSIN